MKKLNSFTRLEVGGKKSGANPWLEKPSESRVAVNVRLPPEVTVKFSSVGLTCVDCLS